MDELPPPPYPSLITTGLVVVSTIFPVLSATSIVLRIVARNKSRNGLQADDCWLFASWFLTLALSILVWVYAGKSGVNYYNVDFLTGTEASLELVFISSCYVNFPLAAIKISVLLFYKRIFTTPMFKTCVWFAIGLVSLWGIIFFLLILLEIDPVAFPLTAVSLRFDSTALGLGQVASSFTLDILVLCLPLPVISRLNMQSKRKFAVVMIFWLGAFCAVAAIVRTVLLDQSIRSVVSSASYDHVANQSKQYIFMILEPNCSIVAACLPTYGPLLAGGRAPESMIRSVRSLFSLFSLRSGGGSGSDGSRPSRGNVSAAGHNRRNYLGLGPSDQRINATGSVNDSQVELQGVGQWPGKGQQAFVISGERLGDDVLPVPPTANLKGIFITNGVSVQRE